MTDNASLILYTYWRSTAAYRVRMGLNLKGLTAEQRSVHLVRDGGEQFDEEYTRLNPQQLVPTLVHGRTVVTQSMAILEYLDEGFDGPGLLPSAPADRARVRSLAQLVACDIHPINNLRVLQYLTGELGADETGKIAWIHHWINTGFDALERRLDGEPETGDYCHGNQPGMADCCLLAQVYNARRFECDESRWPTIRRICQALEALPEIRQAAPENQPDAPGVQ